MKRTLLIILISGMVSGFCFPQSLLDIYKKGPVKLTPDKSYGARNNWQTLFNLYYDSINFSEEEGNKKIIVAPDGSVFMSHRNRHEIWKFGPDGNFVKNFGSKGGKPNQFPMLPSVQPVVDGKYVFTTDVNARLKFFDLNGNYFKSITLDYMTGYFQPSGNGEILLNGNVMWKSEDQNFISYKWRHIIVNLNVYTGKEKIIFSVFEPGDFKYPKTTNKDSMNVMIPVQAPDNKIYLPYYMAFKRPEFTLLKDGQFILTNKETGDVRVFDKTAKEIGSFKLDITPVAITEKDVQEHFESVNKSILESIERTKKITTMPETRKQLIISQNEAFLGKIDRYKDIKNYFPHLPYFSNIILDDEGNFLVFEFTDKEESVSNIFNVIAYDSNGNKLARTSFISDDYDLSFSESTFVISKGYVYAVAKLKNTSEMPLRLVKFKITN
jgi:hypothetical protein